MITRRSTPTVRVGSIFLGSSHPIAIQSMTNTDTENIDLTCEQVHGIYSGEYDNWSELGGENTPIAALQRIKGSGSQSVMESFMGDTPIVKDYDTFLGRAIGFSFRYYVEGIVDKGGVKLLSLDGVAPTKENIRSGSYPVISEIYAIYRADDQSENLALLLEWICGEEGQRIIDETGYVSYFDFPSAD